MKRILINSKLLDLKIIFIFATGFKSQLVKKKPKICSNILKIQNLKQQIWFIPSTLFLKKIKYDDIIILYSDILFEKKCLNQIIKDKEKYQL